MAKTKKNDLQERLERYRQIKLTVVFKDEKLYLLPVRGSDTQWYRNILKNPSIRIDARGEESGFRALPIKETEASNPGRQVSRKIWSR